MRISFKRLLFLRNTWSNTILFENLSFAFQTGNHLTFCFFPTDSYLFILMDSSLRKLHENSKNLNGIDLRIKPTLCSLAWWFYWALWVSLSVIQWILPLRDFLQLKLSFRVVSGSCHFVVKNFRFCFYFICSFPLFIFHTSVRSSGIYFSSSNYVAA